MQRVRTPRTVLLIGIAIISVAFASPAMAACISQPIKVAFVENVSAQSGCLFTNGAGFCGHGQVVPLGQATETIEFGACGATCDVRIITLEGGTLILHETVVSFSCPGPNSPDCNRPGRGIPTTGILADTIVGGTGDYAGASGTLNGTVHIAGNSTKITLSGTLILC
jgi:hypothetical protein